MAYNESHTMNLTIQRLLSFAIHKETTNEMIFPDAVMEGTQITE
jgi:hypothetical protein